MPRKLIAHISLATLLLSVAIASQAQNAGDDTDAEISQTLQGIERTWLKAEQEHDAATFEKLVSDDWSALEPDGRTLSKSERAAKIKSGSISSATMGEMKVRVYGDTAVVTGSDDESSLENGQKVTHHYAWTDVFLKRGGKWIAVASQTALVK